MNKKRAVFKPPFLPIKLNEKLITNYSFVVAGVIEVVARPATKLAFAIPPST